MSLMLYDTILGNIFGVTIEKYPVRGGGGACSKPGANFFNVHTRGHSNADIFKKRMRWEATSKSVLCGNVILV